jgi:MOSC domain
MRQAYGEHLADGIAGENILIGQDQLIGEDDLRHGIAIETSGGTMIQLDNLTVATPCVEFSRYAMRFPADQHPDETVTETLQFLNDRMRGYYASYSGQDAEVRVGDRVFVQWPEA